MASRLFVVTARRISSGSANSDVPGQLERNTPAFDHSAVDVAPLDVEEPAAGCGLIEAIGGLERPGPSDDLGWDELVGRCRSAEWNAKSQGQDSRPCKPRRNEASQSIVGRAVQVMPPHACA